MVAIIFFRADVHIWLIIPPSPCPHLSTSAWPPPPPPPNVRISFMDGPVWDFRMLRPKFVKFVMSILKRRLDSSPNFVSLFSVMKDNTSNNIYFAQKEPIKVNFFETFQCSGQNLSNFSCPFWNDKSIPLQILYHFSVSSKITPLYFFSSNNVYFA